MQMLEDDAKLEKLKQKADLMEKEEGDQRRLKDLREERLKQLEKWYLDLCRTFKNEDLAEIQKEASGSLGPQMEKKEGLEILIRNILTEIGSMQERKNMLL